MAGNQSKTLLVTGAAGQLGRRVVELLLENGDNRIVATTRAPEKLADFAARGVIVRKADFDDAGSLPEVFAGAERLLLISTDEVIRPGHRSVQHRNAIEAAGRAGVKHLVYTSVQNPDAGTVVPIARDHHETEEALAASKLSWTVLRNNLYQEILLMSLPQAVASGKLFAAAGKGGAAYVAREDCARAAAAALASSDTSNRAIDITGPAVVGFDEVARIASELSGRNVVHVPLDPADFKAGMVQAGMPEFYAEIFVSFHQAMEKGRLGPASSGVQELTGRAPISTAEFLSQHRQALLPAS